MSEEETGLLQEGTNKEIEEYSHEIERSAMDIVTHVNSKEELDEMFSKIDFPIKFGKGIFESKYGSITAEDGDAKISVGTVIVNTFRDIENRPTVGSIQFLNRDTKSLVLHESMGGFSLRQGDYLDDSFESHISGNVAIDTIHLGYKSTMRDGIWLPITLHEFGHAYYSDKIKHLGLEGKNARATLKFNSQVNNTPISESDLEDVNNLLAKFDGEPILMGERLTPDEFNTVITNELQASAYAVYRMREICDFLDLDFEKYKERYITAYAISLATYLINKPDEVK